MAGTDHRHWSTRPDLGALLSLPAKPIPTMDLLPGARTAGGFNTAQAGARRVGGECKAESRGCVSSLISPFYQEFALSLDPLRASETLPGHSERLQRTPLNS